MGKGGHDCVEFLKWALPKMDMRWEGFKKVRSQVCRRIKKRIDELELENFSSYKIYLENHPPEWSLLDQLTHINISRFFRDRKGWKALGNTLLPKLAESAHAEERSFRCWSAGCASGEEAYSLAILWKMKVTPLLPNLQLDLIATDKDSKILERAMSACYSPGSLKELPNEWLLDIFNRVDKKYCLDSSIRKMVSFYRQDIRTEMPEGPFDLVFCKNLAGMYFSEELATATFRKISERMRIGALLFLGNHEQLPLHHLKDLEELDKGMRIYRKI